MKTKKILYTSLLLLLGFVGYSQTVTVNDAGFKAYLLGLVDTNRGGNSDGEIQVSEAEVHIGSVVYLQPLTDATGIEAFINITTLALSQNGLTSIDVTNLVDLTDLTLSDNSIETINLSANTLLEDLRLENNLLTSLDLSTNEQLSTVYLDDNQLSSITFGAADYTVIDATNNAMETLTLDGYASLDYLDFVGNDLISVSVTNSDVNQLRLSNNNISTLTLTGSTVSRFLLDINNLSSFDFTNLSTVTYVALAANPNLSSLDVSSLSDLSTLYLNDCALTTLDISNNTALTTLGAESTGLSSLDVSANILLTHLDVSETDLSALNVQNGNNSNFTFFDIRNTNSLSCVEVDDVSYSTTNWTLKPSGTTYSLACAPELVSSTIADDSEYASAYLNYTLTFNKAVSIDQSTNMFRLYRFLGGSYTNMSAFISEVGSNYVSFEYPGLLNNGESYALLVDPDAVEDLSGNAYEGIIDETGLNFATTWEEPVVSKSPTQNETGVAVDGALTLSFDRDIKIGLGGMSGATIISLRLASDLSVVEEVTFDSPNVTLASANFSFLPSDDLAFDTQYRVIVNPHIVETDGEDGKTWAGLNDASGDKSWYFTTAPAPDLDTPTISIQSPTDGALDVSRTDNIICTFSEDIVLGSGTITLGYVGISGQQFATYSIPSATEVTVSGDQLIINPATDLPPLEDIYVSITAGTVEDLAGNDFEGIIDEESWNFTTIDDVAPVVQGFTPYDGSTYGVLSATSSFYFNEDMQEAPGTISLYKADHTLVESITTGVSDARIGFPVLWRITLDFDTDLEELVEYYITISDGAFEDLSGNAYAGVAVGDWRFTANARPHIATLSPADGSTQVAIDASFTLDLDMAAWANSESELEIRNYDTDALIETISIADVESEEGVIAFTPTLLTQGLHAYIILGSGEIASSNNGEKFIGLDDKNEWDFTTVPLDETAPQVTSFSPDDDAVGVAVDLGEMIITFDEPVQLTLATNILLRNISNDIIIQYNQSNNLSEIAIADNVVTLNLPVDLAYDTFHYIQIVSGSFEDLAGNSFVGFSDASSWNFTTVPVPDTTAPVILSLSPASDAVDVAIDQVLNITFDESIAVPTVLQGFIRILNQDGSTFTNIPMSQSGIDEGYLTINENQITFSRGTFEYNTSYYINIDNNTIRDEAGNGMEALSGSTSWSFHTMDEPDLVAPQIVSFSPEVNATGVPFNGDLVVTFDEPILAGSSNIRVRTLNGTICFAGRPQFETEMFTVSGSALTIHLAEASYTAMTNGQVYYVEILNGAIKDVAGNLFEDEFTDTETWRFETGPAIGTNSPQIVSVSPSNGATGVALSADLVLTFDKVIEAGSGYLRLKTKIGDVSKLSGRPQFDTDLISIDGSTMTIHLSHWQENQTNDNLLLLNGVEYYTYMDFGVIKDLDGNSFEGLNDPAIWSFTMEPPVTPVSFTPEHGATDVAANVGSLTMHMDREMVAGTGTFRVRNVGSNQIVQEFEMGTGEVTFLGNDITLNNVTGLNPGSSYWVQNFNSTLHEYAAKDAEGNSLINWTNAETWSFTTAKLDQTITIEDIPDKLITNDPFNVVASIDSELTLTYEVSGPASINGTTITLTGQTGVVTVTVTQPGNGTYNAASAQVMFNVVDPGKTDQTITFGVLEDKVFQDAAFDLTASASSGLSVIFSVISGPVTISGNTVTITGAGEVVVAANQAGNESFNAAEQVTQSLTIEKANQAITINSISNKLTTDDSFTVSATVDTGLPLTYEVSGPATITGSLVTLTGLIGNVTVTVSQAGNANYFDASSTTSFAVTDPAKTAQTINFVAIADRVFGDSDFALTATASSSLEVIFSVVSGPATIIGDMVTITGAGEVAIAANQSGDESFNPAPEIIQSFTVTKADQTISITAITDKLTTDAAFDVVASTASELTLTYAVSGPATISGTTITLDGSVGTVTVTVSQAGNDQFYSTETTVTFEVTEEPVTSIEDGVIQVLIYPNPASDWIKIEGRELNGLSVQVFDLKGNRLIDERFILHNTLSVQTLNEGFYIMKVSSNDLTTTTKLIIRK